MENRFLARELTRRAFIKKSIIGTSAIGLAGLFPSGCEKYPEPDFSLKTFTPKEYFILKTIADRLIPKGGEFSLGANDVDVAKSLDEYLYYEDKDVQKQFKALLYIIEYGPPIFSLKFSKFTNLSDSEKDIYLNEWNYSSLNFRRMGFIAVKKACMFAFYGNDESWKYIGYDGPWV